MSELFAAELTVCVDAGSLPGYLALAPTLALQREFDIAVSWLPLTAGLQGLSDRQPNAAADDPLAEYKARRQAARDSWAGRELERDCGRLGLDVEAGARRFDSTMASMGLLYVNRSGGDAAGYLERVFERGFRQQADIGSLEEIAAIVGNGGFADYAAGAGKAELQALQDTLMEAGIFASPAYVHADERFHGRQHLPLLRWYLGGRTGTPPI